MKYVMPAVVFLGFALGCSNGDGWFGQSKKNQEWQDNTVEQFMSQGMSEVEAKRAFGQMHAHWQTDTMVPEEATVTVERDDF